MLVIHFLSLFLWHVAAKTSAPQVKLTTGTFRGLATNGTDRFLGIRYAQPPTGTLRFRPPVAITTALPGVQDALTFGDACPQPAGGLGAPAGEDCLFLNVWRPQNTSAGAKLPVLVWIHVSSISESPQHLTWEQGRGIVTRSIANGKPIILVTINYRLNTFGFLASSHVPISSLNAGLQDQRAAFTFVQENIAQFGGDPAKVTIWGQSAGAGSVEAQILFPSPRPLFRAAIMDSMTGPFKNSPAPSTFDEPGKPFDLLIKAMDCAAGPTAFSCLQQVPFQARRAHVSPRVRVVQWRFQTLANFSNTMISGTLNHQFWEPTIAPGSFSPVRASKVVASGKFLHVPMIAGTNLNEGATFSSSLLDLNLSGTAQDARFDQFVKDSVIDQTKITSDVLARIHTLYPANTESLPFSTGDSLFDRASAWYGDNMFLAARRRFVQKAAASAPVFAYHFREFIPGNNATFGVAHASELPLFFGPVPDPSDELDFANTYLDFYIGFIHDLNPGAAWPQFQGATPLVLQLMRDNITAIVDDFRSDMTDFLNTPEVLNEWEK
ncbi:alpha/beta-hydrolase [Auriscalpium vulgare]|uniref:Alpha/beta-hydrolase n=1 Tax=Auriscalpium vulgare TaxID=40419 RepID=A0ACB8SB96_9AGAM|nr:alpha/beta-hydrolase [Auriscalpium vulgare]